MIAHHRLALLAAALLVAATTGCLTTTATVALTDSHQECLANPSAHDQLAPWQIAADGAGSVLQPDDGRAKVTLKAALRDCLFRVEARSERGTGTFGPYLGIDFSAVNVVAGGGRYAFIGATSMTEMRVVIDGVESPAYHTIERPIFSKNRAHVAYLGRDDSGSSLWLDGKEIAHGKTTGAPQQLLGVLDDGRAVFSMMAADGRNQLGLGSWRSTAYDGMSYYSFWQGERFTAFLQHGTAWEVVLDGRTEPLMGSPVGVVSFSPDGAHSLYVSYRGDTAERHYEAVIDGVATALPPSGREGPPAVGLVGALPIMSLSPPPLVLGPDQEQNDALEAAANRESGIFVVGQTTPSIQPTRDDFTANHRARDGMYVQIGTSRGPQFETIDGETLRLDEQGHVHYRGRRASETFEVVDNAVQRLPLAGGAQAAAKADGAKVAGPEAVKAQVAGPHP